MKRKIELTNFTENSNWVQGIVDEYKFSAKLYDEPSIFGINEGRISKLYIEGNANYDRGWDFGEDNKLVNPVVDFLENTFKRWDME